MKNAFLPQFNHIIDPSLKRISLTLDTNGEIVIKSNGLDNTSVEKIIFQNASWINKARQKFESKKGKEVDMLTDREVYYLGEQYPLCIEHVNDANAHQVVFLENKLILYAHTQNERLLYGMIDHFYKNEALRLLPSRIKQWSYKMELYPKQVGFRKTVRQWGSCSTSNHISFNTMMMKLPLLLIDYIIVHELSHISHKHHQKSFWECVWRYIPDYKERIKALKQFTPH